MIKIEVREYQSIPLGYGIAWINLHKNSATCFPIPLNWIARFVRDFYYIISKPRRDSFVEKIERETVERIVESKKRAKLYCIKSSNADH